MRCFLYRDEGWILSPTMIQPKVLDLHLHLLQSQAMWTLPTPLRHSARTHWCSLPSAHKSRQCPARPCAKTRPLHKDTHQLLGEAQWVSLWLPRVRLQRCRVCAYAALMLCTVCMHWGRPPAELRVGVRWAKLAWRFGCIGAAPPFLLRGGSYDYVHVGVTYVVRSVSPPLPPPQHPSQRAPLQGCA
jgi:hypothetical protein